MRKRLELTEARIKTRYDPDWNRKYNANKLEGEKINTLTILNKTNIRSLNNNYSTRLNISWLGHPCDRAPIT